eukprot:scaffold169333_cov52-Attheya_sp.AAC.3
MRRVTSFIQPVAAAIACMTLSWQCHAETSSSLKVEGQVISNRENDPMDRELAFQWTYESFPNPQNDPEGCHSESVRICDPDQVLGDEEIDTIASSIERFERVYTLKCHDEGNSLSKEVPIQLAVGIVKEMNMDEYTDEDDADDVYNNAAKKFAIGVHDKWGVGSSECGGSGILLFLAVNDRSIFISTGAGVKKVLTRSRLNKVIANMKPYLRSGSYQLAILRSFEDMGELMTQGPPSGIERLKEFFMDTIMFWLIGGICGIVGLANARQRQAEREFAEVQSRLNRLDQDRALALQGRYQCKSCPICLENFLPQGEDSTIGIGQEQVSLTRHACSNRLAGSSNSTITLGSDGLPIKLLRCGHVFDETCWLKWVSHGSGSIRRCPICQQDVGGSSPPPEPSSDNTLAQRRERNAGHDWDIHNYQRERAFRLIRMRHRYPRFIRQDQIERWTNRGYDGTLARDPSFARSDPKIERTSNINKRSEKIRPSSSSFGGGRSSGGAGGRW